MTDIITSSAARFGLKSLTLAAAVALMVPAAVRAQEAVTVDNEVKTITDTRNQSIRITGTGELHITSRTPLDGSTIALYGDKSMVCFEGLTVTELKNSALSAVTVDDRAFDAAKDRIVIYGNGSAILPNALEAPLTLYTAENFGGESKVCQPDVYYRSRKSGDKWLEQELLGDFDNSIRSFRLRRGYCAVLANNYDGTGFSKVFIADKEDLEVPVMPQGLEFASFVRVSFFQWIGKRGICGGDLPGLTRSSWFYDWGASAESADDFEYVPMRHNLWWDGWDKIGSRVSTSNVLGYNEPDHADQSSLSPDAAISEWPNFMKSGLRIGSPAPDAVTKDWLKRFIATADSLNYRVDFVATHMYWNSQSPSGLLNTIRNACANDYGNRPMWITEWNNGANWTNEWWPDRNGTKLDAEFNPILDENGNEQTVVRPHTQANSEVQKKWLESILPAFDSSPWLERHSFYNWVEDARMVEIEGKLTPAGEVFANFQSVPGYSAVHQYDHQWKIAPPHLSVKEYQTYFTVGIYDHNGETGASYTIEQSINGSPWEVIAVLEGGKDYSYGRTKNYRVTPEVNGTYRFRVKALSYIGTESVYSRVIGTTVDYASGVADVAVSRAYVKAGAAGELVLVGFGSGTSVGVYNTLGSLVRTVTIPADTDEVSVPGLPRGVYIVSGGYKVAL